MRGGAERGEAIPDGNTKLELRELTVEVSRYKMLARQFHTEQAIVGKAAHQTVF